MVRARSTKASTKGRAKARLEGPTCLRPLTSERFAKMHLDPAGLAHTYPRTIKIRINRHSDLPECVQTTYTLEIFPQSGVAIRDDDLEPAIRAISSPCGNFLWGHAIKTTKVADAEPGTILVGGASVNSTEVLQIILIHTNRNHDGNVRRETIAMFGPTVWDSRDETLEQQEVISIDQILSRIRGWKDKVQRCIIVREHEQKHLMMASKGPAFPNGMGNEKQYPPPWDVKTWNKRVAERKAKQLAYIRKPTGKSSKPEVDGQWDDDDEVVDLDSSESYMASSPSGSSDSEQSEDH